MPRGLSVGEVDKDSVLHEEVPEFYSEEFVSLIDDENFHESKRLDPCFHEAASGVES